MNQTQAAKTNGTSINSADGLPAAESNEADINLIDLLIALGQEKMIIVLVTALAAAVGVVVSLITPASYVARTTVMTSQQSGGGGLPSLGNLSGLFGLGALSSGIAGGIKSSDDTHIALMRSHSVQSALIEKFKLRERYGSKNLEEAKLALTSNVRILSDKKSGLMFIDAQDRDAPFAAELANAQVRELSLILSRLAVTEAQQRRAYYEQQVAKAQEKMPQFEAEFKQAQRSSGIEVASLLSEAGTLPGQIAAKELQLSVLSRFATPQNPDLKRLSGEISALRSQLSRYELSKAEPAAKDPNQSGKKEQATETSRAAMVQKATQAYNTLKIQEAMLDGYVKQLEIAKIDKANEGPALQVVDEARAPEIRAQPQRTKMVIAFTVTGFVLAFALAAIRALLRHVTSTPEGQARWHQLKRSWSFP